MEFPDQVPKAKAKPGALPFSEFAPVLVAVGDGEPPPPPEEEEEEEAGPAEKEAAVPPTSAQREFDSPVGGYRPARCVEAWFGVRKLTQHNTPQYSNTAQRGFGRVVVLCGGSGVAGRG